MVSVATDNGGHFCAIFRVKENEWLQYDGMKRPTITPLKKEATELCNDPYHVTWAIYVDLEYVKDNFKRLYREFDQLIDNRPGPYWKTTPGRTERKK